MILGVRKNRCHILGHGLLAGNCSEIAGAGQTVTKFISRQPMKLGWSLKMTARLDLVGVCKQSMPIKQLEVPQKCIFLIFGDIIVKFWHFPYLKKLLNEWNWLAAPNNSTVELPDSVLQLGIQQ